MPERIGSAGNKAMALVERITPSLIARNKPGKEPGEFDEGLELEYHGPTHGIKQVQPRGPVQRRFAGRDSIPVPAAVTRAHSDGDIVLPAPAVTMPLTSILKKGEEEVGAGEPLSAENLTEKGPESVPRISVGEVADIVYNLMRRDLILEKELSDRGNKLW